MTSKPSSKGPPPVPADLVEYLEGVYPNRFPSQVLGSDPHAITADLHRHAGRLEVVQFLRDHLTRQTEKAVHAPNTAEA